MAAPGGSGGDDASAAIRQQVYMSELQDNCLVRGFQGLVGGAIVGVIFGNLFVSVRRRRIPARRPVPRGRAAGPSLTRPAAPAPPTDSSRAIPSTTPPPAPPRPPRAPPGPRPRRPPPRRGWRRGGRPCARSARRWWSGAGAARSCAASSGGCTPRRSAVRRRYAPARARGRRRRRGRARLSVTRFLPARCDATGSIHRQTRAKHDIYNTMFAGCVAGSTMVSGGVPARCFGCVSMAAFSAGTETRAASPPPGRPAAADAVPAARALTAAHPARAPLASRTGMDKLMEGRDH